MIVPEDAAEPQTFEVARIYSPEDGRSPGLQGIIDDMIKRADFDAVRSTK